MIVIPQKAEGEFAEVEFLTSRDFGLTRTEDCSLWTRPNAEARALRSENMTCDVLSSLNPPSTAEG